MSITDGETLRLEGIIAKLQAKSECDDALLIAMSEKCEKLKDKLGQVYRQQAEDLDIASDAMEWAANERDKLTAERDRLRDHIHTCGPTCSKAGCMNRRLRDAAQVALDALENSVDLVSNECQEYVNLYGDYPTRAAKIDGMIAGVKDHEDAITQLRAALGEKS